MRVAHVITRMIVGGAQENTFFNAADLVELHGDDVLLVTGPTDGPEGKLLERSPPPFKVEVLPQLVRAIRPASDWLAYRRLLKVLADFRPDVVHTHSSKAGILGRMAAWRRQTPAVVHTIHGLPFHPFQSRVKNAIYIHAERWAAKRCHRILSVADAMTLQALAVGIGHPEQYRTVYSGMDVQPFLAASQAPGSVRREWGVPDDALLIGKFARLFELKGHDDVLSAAPEVFRQLPNAHFMFVGGGSWRDRIEKRVHNDGFAGRVHFTGLVDPARIPELIAACDIVVHASYREGLARVLPQALIAGKPVVAYDLDGAREVVLPDTTGHLVRAGQITDLARALVDLGQDANKRARFGRTGRERFTERFRHETMTRQIRQVYEEILTSRPS